MKAKHLNIALVGVLLSLTSSATADNVKHESVISELFEQVSGLVPCAIPSGDFVPSSDEPRNDCLSHISQADKTKIRDLPPIMA
jgi:hypothetical protein